MSVVLCSAAGFDLERLTELFAASFEGYLVPVAQPTDVLAARIRSEQIDLHLSRVLLVDGEPAGLCLLAQRGWRMRVAAMGIVAGQRGRRLGRALLDDAVAVSRAAGADRLVLEVLSPNQAALALYDSAGFRRQRRLLGFASSALPVAAAPEHQLASPESLAAALAAEPERAWPWQLSPHTLVAAAPEALHVHALGSEAFACVSRPGPGRLSLRLLYVVPSARRQGRARRLLGAIQSLDPEATWDVPPLVPEEFDVAAMAALGFAQGELHQFEMELALAD
jgi:ribosomal protein S18 acetylase RimI-like enzyme